MKMRKSVLTWLGHLEISRLKQSLNWNRLLAVKRCGPNSSSSTSGYIIEIQNIFILLNSFLERGVMIENILDINLMCLAFINPTYFYVRLVVLVQLRILIKFCFQIMNKKQIKHDKVKDY